MEFLRCFFASSIPCMKHRSHFFQAVGNAVDYLIATEGDVQGDQVMPGEHCLWLRKTKPSNPTKLNPPKRASAPITTRTFTPPQALPSINFANDQLGPVAQKLCRALLTIERDNDELAGVLEAIRNDSGSGHCFTHQELGVYLKELEKESRSKAQAFVTYPAAPASSHLITSKRKEVWFVQFCFRGELTNERTFFSRNEASIQLFREDHQVGRSNPGEPSFDFGAEGTTPALVSFPLHLSYCLLQNTLA